MVAMVALAIAVPLVIVAVTAISTEITGVVALETLAEFEAVQATPANSLNEGQNRYHQGQKEYVTTITESFEEPIANPRTPKP